MSVLNTRLSGADLKAPPGQFRVVKMSKPAGAADDAAERFLVEDFVEKHAAIDRWRNLTLARRRDGKHDLSYSVLNDEGRLVGVLGTLITEEERKAPPGKFRIVCVDFAREPQIWLVADLDDKEKAIEYAKNAYEGPYTGFQIHDDTGAALIPV